MSLGGGGAWGPLPVGPAAEEQDQLDQEQQAEDLAGEVEEGGLRTRQLWRWACFATAEAAAAEAVGEWGYLVVSYTELLLGRRQLSVLGIRSLESCINNYWRNQTACCVTSGRAV